MDTYYRKKKSCQNILAKKFVFNSLVQVVLSTVCFNFLLNTKYFLFSWEYCMVAEVQMIYNLPTGRLSSY